MEILKNIVVTVVNIIYMVKHNYISVVCLFDISHSNFINNFSKYSYS